MYRCTDLQKDSKYAVASLSLYSLVNAFKRGSYQVKTTSFDEIVSNNAKFSPFASHVESTYLLTQDEALKKLYVSRNGTGIRYGKIIEELDAMAGDCSYKYLLDEN